MSERGLYDLASTEWLDGRNAEKFTHPCLLLCPGSVRARKGRNEKYYKNVEERVTMNGKVLMSVNEWGTRKEAEKSKAAVVGRKRGRGGR